MNMKGHKMKLSQFPDQLFRIISKEEIELELPVSKATIRITLRKGKEIILHEWEYEAGKKDLAPLELLDE